MNALDDLPVAVIGGGPVGLAAVAHLLDRGLPVKLYEAGSQVGLNMRDWGHVRVFTPWRYCVDAMAMNFLRRHNWTIPAPDSFPTGSDIVQDYLEPLAALPEFSGIIETGARVLAISRFGADKVMSRNRENLPFDLIVETGDGTRRDQARAIIDASGTWQTPNPLGSSGLFVIGETSFANQIDYGIPDILGRSKQSYTGKTTLVIGSGHSAANALLDLARLASEAPETRSIWATRGSNLARIYSGEKADQLPQRGELGADVMELVERGGTTLVSGFSTISLQSHNGRLFVEGQTAAGLRQIGPIDRIVAATGQRPNLEMTRELRLELDPWLESARALGPLIDPNLHSCGTVPPHGHRELSHPEPGFYTVGIKSYGRAPTFLLLTGYEQVRSVVAALDGDMAAANDVHLVLPETGICTSATNLAATCCGGPAPDQSDACCVADAAAKSACKTGCGCECSEAA